MSNFWAISKKKVNICIVKIIIDFWANIIFLYLSPGWILRKINYDKKFAFSSLTIVRRVEQDNALWIFLQIRHIAIQKDSSWLHHNIALSASFCICNVILRIDWPQFFSLFLLIRQNIESKYYDSDVKYFLDDVSIIHYFLFGRTD